MAPPYVKMGLFAQFGALDTIEVKPHVWFRRSYEAMNAIVKGQMREKCMLLIANKDIDEYEFSDGQGV